MIPMFAIIRIQTPHHRSFRFWFPLFLIWILLLPLFILAMPFFFLACLITWLNPFTALGIFLEIFSSTRGTLIDVSTGQQAIYISIK
mgnify:CR=1 FL=1